MTLERWRYLAEEASTAFGQDFRYAEEMARQAVSLRERQKKSRRQKQEKTADQPRRPV